MTEAHKKIWLDDTPYVRADLVNELVEACIELLEDEADIIFRTDFQSTYKCIGRLNVALLKLEESYE